MVLLPGCTCCGDKCKPCPYCTSEKCFKVTFSGFSQLPDTFSDCSDCRHLDNTTIVVRTHQAQNPGVTLTVTDQSGTGATFSNTLTTNEDNSLSVASASVTAGGSGYLSPVLVATPTQSSEGALGLYDTSIVCKQPTATFTLGENGTITGITITDGGEIWPGAAIYLSPCGYSGGVCGGCPKEVSVSASYHPGARSTISGGLVFGNDGHSLGLAGTLAVTATARSIDEQGNSLQCDSVSFPPERATGCYGNGTISVEPIDCDAQSVSPCPMPEQISLRVQWPAYTGWGVNSTDWLNCQILPASDTDAYDETFILDRVTSFDFWGNGLKVYSPCSTIYGDNYSAGPQVHFHPLDNVVTATISPPDVPPSWYIDPPERRTATAEVVGISGDQLTQAAITDGGAGYQYEIQQRVAPTITLTADDSGGGSGALLTATLEQIGTGDEAVWGIQSVTVVDGGTGYPPYGVVNATTAEGQTTVEEAGLVFISENGIITEVVNFFITAPFGKYFGAQPTGQMHTSVPTVTIDAKIGGGATATASVSGGVVSSISVTNGGSGYSPQRVVWVVDILCPFPSPNGGSTMYMQAGYSGADFADPFVDFFQSVPGLTISTPTREGLAAAARACAGATPLADKISDNCPADLFGTYGLGVKTRRTWAASAPNGACGLDDPSGSTGYQTGGPNQPSGNLCLYWYSLYGTPLPKVWWLAGGSATIEAVDP